MLVHCLTLLLTLVSSYVHKQNKKLCIQTLTLTSVHHPVLTVITKVNVALAVRENVSESKSLPLLTKPGLPSAACSRSVSLFFMDSFHKPVQLTPQKEVWVVLCWVGKLNHPMERHNEVQSSWEGWDRTPEPAAGQKKGWVEKKREQDLPVCGSMLLEKEIQLQH